MERERPSGTETSDENKEGVLEKMDVQHMCELSSPINATYESEEREYESWKLCQERKNIILEFLNSELSVRQITMHHMRVELLKKCSYYIEILPKHLALGDQNHLMLPNAMLQLINPRKFQRMKKVGTAQTKIQLLLLSDLLEKLKQGREALMDHLKDCNTTTLLSEWDTISQRLSQLSGLLDNFLNMLVPGKLYIKHRLVSDTGITKIPHIRLVLRARMPVAFDRKESMAYEDWACLKWFRMGQPTQPEKFELRYRLVDPQTLHEQVQSGGIIIPTCSFEIKNLLSDKSYEFSIKRAETYSLVYEAWHDTMTLRTKPSGSENIQSMD